MVASTHDDMQPPSLTLSVLPAPRAEDDVLVLDVAADEDALRVLLQRARPENTRRTYAQAWSRFAAYARARGVQPLPTSADVLAAYVAHLLRTGSSKSTITVARAAVLAVHADAGYVEDSRLMADHYGLRMAMRGVSQHFRQQRVAATQARALTRDEVEAASRVCPATAQGVQDRAVLLLGCNLGLRASEITNLRVGDVTEVTGRGLDVLVRYSKTDQEGRGSTLALSSLPPRLHEVDGVRAVSAWLDVLRDLGDATPDAFLVRRIHRGGARVYPGDVAVGEQSISDLVRRCAARAAMTTDGLSGHSLRATMATLAYQAGVSEERIAATTRHGSVQVLRGYDRSGQWINPSSAAMWA